MPVEPSGRAEGVPPAVTPAALRTLAVIEAAKGVSALLLVFALLVWNHEDDPVQTVSSAFAWLHFDLAGTLTRRLIDAFTRLAAPMPMSLVLVLIAYAAARLIESWGLWRSRPWARWLAVVSSAAFVPIELEALIRQLSFWKLLILAINLVVIGWLLHGLRRPGRLALIEEGR